ncbi:hypothetical protein CANCADRAFT_112103 [Tortispora caseinolytica NRRL Y-17796]|uniref:ADP-ribosylation factor-like protein 3 n=1 Tax=Tortispora caseinolytica NRRL Y-17796 TaxID=767744 RepID=A0A1E4TGM2_9ASCO|nr:hypothetical protein CANCADRAFT_112103 [Tortispora caseinolytica NRRL Y-17796]
MYHLAKSVYLNLTRTDEYTILILGLDNAGKTTLLERIKSDFGGSRMPSATVPTIGQNVAKVTVDGVKLKLRDVGGQEALRSMWINHYATCHGMVFVVDSTDQERIQECINELISIADHEDLEGVPILMLANKQDLDSSLEIEQIKEIFNPVAAHLSARDSRVLPISALTGEGVTGAAQWIATRAVRNREYRLPNRVN